jgi:uncharacterized glyoxalase superfamily protein PhnB
MSDPFDVLRTPIVPVAPDPGFTAALRHRLTIALSEGDEGGEMTGTSIPETPATVVGSRPTLSAYLAVDDAHRALDWYTSVFGGRVGETVEMPDGRLGHAEVHIGNAVLMLADEFEEIDFRSPRSRGGTTVSIVVDGDDVDATTAAAAALGATVERPPADMPYGFRAASVVDPFGHRWLIEAPLDGPPRAAAAPEDA